MARQNFSINLSGPLRIHISERNVKDRVVITTGPSRSATETYVGVKRRKPKVLVLNPTPYKFTRSRIDDASGTLVHTVSDKDTGVFRARYTYDGKLKPGETSISTPNLFNDVYIQQPSSPSNLRNAAIIKARLKFKSSDINLGVAFGERKETARLVGDTATRLAKTVRELKRGNLRKAMDTLGLSRRQTKPSTTNAHKAWLELQYAWKPFLHDVYGAVDALAKRDKPDWITQGKGVQRINVDRDIISGSGKSRCNVSVTGFELVSCIINATPTNDLQRSLSSLGVTNPALVGWELVPFSFVVDWFLPVGDFLDSLDALLGYEVVNGTLTTFKRAKFAMNGLSNTEFDSAYKREFKASWSASKQSIYLNREVFKDAPFATFPRIKDPRSLGHMANGLSLLAAVFDKR